MSHRSSFASAAERSIAFRRSVGGRLVFARDQKLAARTSLYNAALSSAGTTGCASHGASLFLVWPRKSNQKEGHPYIRVLLRKTSLPPALLRGSSRRAIPGPSLLARHPCLATPCATPTLGLLKGARDRVVWKFLNGDSNKALRPSACSVGWKTAKHFPPQSSPRWISNLARENRWVSFALPTLHKDSAKASLHGPSDTTESPLSGGRVESAWRRASGMDAARGIKGRGRHRYGWPLYAGPRNADGAREVERSEPGTPSPVQGQAFLLTFFGAGHPASGKSESPSRAKPTLQPIRPMGTIQRTQSPHALHAAASSGVKTLTPQVLPC